MCVPVTSLGFRVLGELTLKHFFSQIGLVLQRIRQE
jgi:hypothetical protein